jgi:ATP-dependent RNA helicase DHX37/DHR1
MVNRLRRSLNPPKKCHPSQGRFIGANDVVGGDDENTPREMDDDELDGDDDDMDGELDIAINDNDEVHAEPESGDDRGDNRPVNAYILPLYSMLSAEEQAKVFATVPENHRLIVIATNIAETSITIPGVSYVVDTGRQKCRNYHTGTGVISYDIMWISKAAADQRAGRAGRTGPGHCYRLYSSSLYSRHMDAFAVPEVLLRPLEDVVLSMKALKISDIAKFPFPTPPERAQVNAAVKLLANIGCIDVSRIEEDGGDGAVTKLGLAVAKLPLGVRYGKMLLVAAQAGVLDYAITMVAVLSEASPFQRHEQSFNQEDAENQETSSDDDSEKAASKEAQKKKKKRWQHRGGDVMAAMLAVGAYTYAGRGAGGVSEQLACRKFCDENGLNYMIMTRVQKLRLHLARLAKIRLSKVDSIASKTGGIVSSMRPPNRLQENLLMQAIASGLLDNIALLAPPGSISGEHPFSLRTAYLSCSNVGNEPLFMDRDSVVFSRDSRQLPQWVCYDFVLRKTAKDGTPVSVMKKVTPIEASWLGALAKGSRLLVLGAPLSVPSPIYDVEKDAVMCAVVTKFGSHGWEVPPVRLEMFDVLQSKEVKHSAEFMADDSFRWFARFLLEGKVFSDFKALQEMLNDSPAIITRRAPTAKIGLLVSELSSAGVDNAAALKRHWAEKDNKFLFKCIKSWIKRENHSEAKQLWIAAVKKHTAKTK